jgi:hypothetical protein
MVEWIEDKGQAVVSQGATQVNVGIVDPSPRPKYSRHLPVLAAQQSSSRLPRRQPNL